MHREASEALFRAIVESTPDAVIVANPDGVVSFWNGGAERIFGFSADEAVGRSLDLIVPERLRQRHWAGYRRVMETGQTRYGTGLLAVPAMRKDGESLSIEFTVALLRSADGALTGIAAIVRDVTARWQREQELRKRLAILEQGT
jgi:PAS domain S-box-containing protein